MSDSNPPTERDDPKLRQILDSAADLPVERRAAFLDQACGGDGRLREQVQSLLCALMQADDFLANPTVDDPPDSISTTASHETESTQIGPYKLLQKIGEGGMGVVYMAEQERPVVRRVAIKIIKMGMDTRQVIARFEAERQALALMDHPNIARVLDAGATDTGRPYFVMELVRGVSITEYCDTNNLSTRQRLELFLPVCRAVQHAHQKGIIHRDIKPSNVLITMHDGVPVPKVIDFGIAKATSGRLTDKTLFTQYHQFVGTPQYMSPEQAEMSGLDIDTRADVYALGVLLYELLTGTTPFDEKTLRQAAFAEIQRIIREVEPPKPSTRLSTLADMLTSVAVHRGIDPRRLSALMRGDLDWIVMKCLEKDRTRRYETANAIAMDVQRYLKDEPVEASPPSATYKLRKFARKYKKEAAVTIMLVALLVLGIVGTTIGLVHSRLLLGRAQAAEKFATEEKNDANKSKEEAQLRLRDSYIAQARALRSSGRAGRRFESLELISRAKAIHDGPDLRNEVAAALALTDLRRIREFDAPAVEVAFDANLTRYGYDHADGTMGVHSTDDDRLLLSLSGSGHGTHNLGFSRDGHYLHAIDDLQTVRVWDLVHPSTALLVPQKSAPTHIRATPDSSEIAISDGSSLHLFSLPTMHRRTLSLGPFRWFELSPDGNLVVVGATAPGVGEVVNIHDLSSGVRLAQLPHPAAVTGAAWEPSCARLVTRDSNDGVRVWDWRRGSVRATLRGHLTVVTSLAYSPDGALIGSLSWDGTLRLWNADTGEELSRAYIGGNGLQFSADGRRMAFSSFEAGDRRKQLWEVASGAMRVLAGGKWNADFSPDGRLLVGGNAAGGGLWDARSGKRLGTLSAGPQSVHVQQDGAALITITDSMALARFPILSGPTSDTLRLGPAEPLLNRQGDKLMALTSRGPQFLDRAPLQQAIAARPGSSLRDVSATCGGPWAAAIVVARSSLPSTKFPWGSESVILVWNREASDPPRSFPAPEATYLFFSADGRWLAARAEHALRVWRTGTWEEHVFAEDGGFARVIFSPDGRVMAVAVSPTQVRLRETNTWHELVTLETPQAYSQVAGALSADGGRLAMTTEGSIVLWDLRTIRDGLSAMGLDWSKSSGPTVGDNDTAGWGPPNLLYLEQNVTSLTR